jgi:hypothetical protein
MLNNPRSYATRMLGARARLFAKDNSIGARVEDHDVVTQLLADMVIVGLYKIAKQNKLALRFGASGFVDVVSLDFANLSTWPGRVYDIAFSLARGTLDTTWTWSKRTEATLADSADYPGIATRSSVSMFGSEDENPCAPHQRGPLNFSASAGTVSRSVGDWSDLALSPGDSIVVAGSASNDGTFTVLSVNVDQDEITVLEALTDESTPLGFVTIEKGT